MSVRGRADGDAALSGRSSTPQLVSSGAAEVRRSAKDQRGSNGAQELSLARSRVARDAKFRSDAGRRKAKGFSEVKPELDNSLFTVDPAAPKELQVVQTQLLQWRFLNAKMSREIEDIESGTGSRGSIEKQIRDIEGLLTEIGRAEEELRSAQEAQQQLVASQILHDRIQVLHLQLQKTNEQNLDQTQHHGAEANLQAFLQCANRVPYMPTRSSQTCSEDDRRAAIENLYLELKEVRQLDALLALAIEQSEYHCSSQVENFEGAQDLVKICSNLDDVSNMISRGDLDNCIELSECAVERSTAYCIEKVLAAAGICVQDQ